MEIFLNILLALVMLGVVFVLVRGLVNMMRGGSGATSNKMMQARVLLQAVAVGLIVLVAYLFGGGA